MKNQMKNEMKVIMEMYNDIKLIRSKVNQGIIDINNMCVENNIEIIDDHDADVIEWELNGAFYMDRNVEFWIKLKEKEYKYMGYEISSYGRVRDCTGINRNAYYHNNHWHLDIIVNRRGDRKTVAIHRLVALNFIKNPKQYRLVKYYNQFIQYENNVNNLYWTNYN